MSVNREYVVIWIGNGFDANEPNHSDRFAKASLQIAFNRYQELKSQGHLVKFLILKAMAKNKHGFHDYEIMTKEAFSQGVDREDFNVIKGETINAPSDGLILSNFAQANPEKAEIEIFVPGNKITAKYFEATYKAVGLHITGYQFKFKINYPRLEKFPKPKLVSNILYVLLLIIVLVAGLHRLLFKLYYNLRLYLDNKKRSKDFTSVLK